MPQKYTWKQGDNLFDLAEQYGTTSAAILEANPGLRQPLPGIVLSIPGGVVGDPKGPWTPDLPTPDPKDTYVPPVIPPVQVVPDPKGPWTADLPTPAPGAITPPVQLPPLEPSRPGLPALPPLEPSRVGAPPIYRSPTLIDPRANIPALQPGYVRPVERQPFDWTRPIIPADAPVARGIMPGIDWNNLLGYGSQAGESGRLRRIVENNPQLANRLFANLSDYRPAPRRPSRAAGGYSTGTALGDSYLRALIQGGMTPTALQPMISSPELASTVPGTYAPPSVGTFGAQGFPNLEGPEPLRSSILEHYLDLGRLPMIIFREDLARFGITEAELIAAGYVQDQFGDWIRGGMTPAEVEQAAAATGDQPAYTATGRRPARRSSGGGRTSQQYTRGYPVYPSSRGAPYPQSFVQQQRRGVSPTGRSIRPARMGTVDWRI